MVSKTPLSDRLSRLLQTIEKIIEDRLKIPARGLTLTELQGDASYRVYYRALLPSGRTYIVMKMPEGKASASEEITNLAEKSAEIPFVNVGRFLKGRGLPVPEIFFSDERSGILLLEDFGDETLEKRVTEAGDDIRRLWYRKAIDLLKSFQQKTSQPDASCIAYRRSFDATLLNWEFDHFLEYGIEARLGVKIPKDDAQAIRSLTGQIADTLTRMPQRLVHRDFQSRNLMIATQDEAIHLLDFQDALMGPYMYDLVALLRDSYVTLPWSMVEQLIQYYLRSANIEDLNQARRAVEGEAPSGFARGGGDASPYKVFDLMTIQRKLKDAGRFVYIDRVKKNPGFLKSIPSSLAYVREAFERQTKFKDLFALLMKYVPEFR